MTADGSARATGWQPLPAGPLGAVPALPGVGPMLVWADATRWQEHRRPGEPVPPTAVVLAQGRDGRVDVWRPTLTELAGAVRALADAGPARVRLELQEPAVPQRPRPAALAAVPRLGGRRRLSRAGVLVGVIDSGCPFAHRMLRDRSGSGTRVLHLWDQEPGRPSFLSVPGSGRRADLPRGCEIDRRSLNRLMRAHRSGPDAAAIDESACYAQAASWALRGAFSHGAGVLGRLFGPCQPGAAGSARPDQADLVFVQLPRDLAQDSGSAALAASVIEGVDYILRCAGPSTHRVVINVSDGTSRNLHDGTSMIELALRQRVAAMPAGRELHLVVPAGNAHDEERHARLVPGRPLFLRVDPATESTTFVTLRVPANADFELRALAPGEDGASGGWVGVGQGLGWSRGAAQRLQAGLVVTRPLAGAAHAEALLVIGPTGGTEGPDPQAPAGLWRIEARAGRGGADAQLWVCRNQVNPGALPRGHQARFVDMDGRYDAGRVLRAADDDPRRPGSPIRRRGSLNGLATSALAVGPPVVAGGVWVAGACYQDTLAPTVYASRSEPRSAPALPHTWVALDRSRSLPGVRGCGNLSGAHTLVTGTSFAAPTLARWLALQPAGVPIVPPHALP